MLQALLQEPSRSAHLRVMNDSHTNRNP